MLRIEQREDPSHDHVGHRPERAVLALIASEKGTLPSVI